MNNTHIPIVGGTTLSLPTSFDRLWDLATNIWWTWDHEAQELWRRIDPQRWAEVGNPVAHLHGVEPEVWDTLETDVAYVDLYERVVRRFDTYMNSSDTWFSERGVDLDGPIAYLCTEYGLHDSLRFYSGGLGVLAGDHLKTSSDLGIPLVAVGLFYRRGYFHQAIDPHGESQHYYAPADLSGIPAYPVADRNGAPLRIPLEFPGRVVEVAVWKVQVGRVQLLMLDTDLPENEAYDRSITHLLYVRGRDARLAQEVVLGFGAVRLLDLLDIAPSAWHVNEGHAAFSLIERLDRQPGESLEERMATVKQNTLFTLHTPVPAGNEKFDMNSVLRYTDYLVPDLPRELVAHLGRVDDFDQAPFDMGGLAIALAAKVNGVSQRHGLVASDTWRHRIGDEADGITNGVHVPTWIGTATSRLFSEAIGSDWERKLTHADAWDVIRDLDPAEVWAAHGTQKRVLLRSLRARIRSQFARHGAGPDWLKEINDMLPEDRLTIGFARRFATYKRATLILSDLPRLQHILTNPERPAQIVFSGKAHPADKGGQELIARIHELAQRPEFRGHLFFIEDYDMELGHLLTAGCDVWLNNPTPPKEASGTSGMKAAINGCLNLSIPDGWWAEAVDHGVNGWTFGPQGLDPNDDLHDADSLYQVLEKEVIPTYYERNNDGLPESWIEMMLNSIAACTHQFSSHRMLAEYTNEAYLPLGSPKT
ncbi:MAG: alpha-glucan family phosphorylase [Acidimicrobiia bacterium]|nr:alpha-glucan family phosphorylase [Acidimicrobiia bacterium]